VTRGRKCEESKIQCVLLRCRRNVLFPIAADLTGCRSRSRICYACDSVRIFRVVFATRSKHVQYLRVFRSSRLMRDIACTMTLSPYAVRLSCRQRRTGGGRPPRTQVVDEDGCDWYIPIPSRNDGEPTSGSGYIPRPDVAFRARATKLLCPRWACRLRRFLSYIPLPRKVRLLAMSRRKHRARSLA